MPWSAWRMPAWGWLLFATASMADVVPANLEKPLCFVAQVTGDSWVMRASGAREPVSAGSRLFVGDQLRVDKGKVLLVDLAGRTIPVKEGEVYKAVKGAGKSSPIIERVMDTLDEISHPPSEADQPLVHGMARGLGGIREMLPANTCLSNQEFAFSWTPVQGASEYTFSLESPDGSVLRSLSLHSPQVSSVLLEVKPGQRYLWRVRTSGTSPDSSDKKWVEVLPQERAAELRDEVARIDKDYSPEVQPLLKGASFYERKCFFEAANLLNEAGKQRELGEMEMRVLAQSYRKMGCWEEVERFAKILGKH